MLPLKAMFILNDHILSPDMSVHYAMLEGLEIRNEAYNSNSSILRVTPPNGDIFTPIDTWVYGIKGLDAPERYMLEQRLDEIDNARVKESVKKWAAKHIFVGVDNLEIYEGESYYLKDCKHVKIGGSATVNYITGSSTVEYIANSATVVRIDGYTIVKCVSNSATVQLLAGSSIVNWVGSSAIVGHIHELAVIDRLCDCARIEWLDGSATVKRVDGCATIRTLFESAVVESINDRAVIQSIDGLAVIRQACGHATIVSSAVYPWNKKDALVLLENATFKDCFARTIRQAGDWTLQKEAI